MSYLVLSYVVAVALPVVALLVAVRAWRPEWFHTPNPRYPPYPPPSGRVRVIMLIIALMIGLGTIPLHGWALRRAECQIAGEIIGAASYTPAERTALYAWRRAAATHGYLITVEVYARSDGTPADEEYQMWHEGRLVAVWDGVTSDTTCRHRD